MNIGIENLEHGIMFTSIISHLSITPWLPLENGIGLGWHSAIYILLNSINLIYKNKISHV
ncbi:hypothetical protein C0030_003625 [Candidatus Liberibacter solanacearum]|uniref:Uncharacterized protein n=1 Tax=Candidatus Liberibacter solanacearum TaxID=556287 RepID=A0A3R7NPV6_9HYPH|nr:hypothetical protein C0030_003625 [Candidatus Liberibacter solanacearum]